MAVKLDRYSFDHNVEIRKANRETVERWFSLDWAESSHGELMDALFVPHGRVQRNFRPEGREEFVGATLREHHASYSEIFRSWTWDEKSVYSTQYPQVFWALAEGHGDLRDGGTRYANAFAFAFVLEDAKIRVLKEWSNPIPVLESRGIAVPHLPK